MIPSPMLSLTLEGADPYAWGTQHGEAFQTEIRELVGIRRGLLLEKMPGWDQERLGVLCEDHLAALVERWPGIHAELSGIAAAAGVRLIDLVLLNAFTDLKDFSARDDDSLEGGCSALAVRGPSVSFAAQTWDMHASAKPYVLAMSVPEAGGTWTRVLTVAGCVGMSGVNGVGVSVLINNVHCRETSRHGLIWPGFVRLLLQQCPPVTTALMPRTLPSSGHHYLLADADQAISFETTGRRFEVLGGVSRTARPGYLVHANHYVGTLRSEEITARLGPTTRVRYQAMENFALQYPADRVDGEFLLQSFLCEGSLCDTVCLRGNGDPHGGVTCGGMMVDHVANRVRLFRGPYADGNRMEWPIR